MEWRSCCNLKSQGPRHRDSARRPQVHHRAPGGVYAARDLWPPCRRFLTRRRRSAVPLGAEPEDWVHEAAARAMNRAEDHQNDHRLIFHRCLRNATDRMIGPRPSARRRREPDRAWARVRATLPAAAP